MQHEHCEQPMPVVDKPEEPKPKMSIEVLEKRVAPAIVGGKKEPMPPPYPPGADYGLICRDNLVW